MPDINLLRDKESVSERSDQKKAGAAIEFTTPAKEKDEVKKRIGGGGVMAFFRSLFSKKEKADLPPEIERKKIIKEEIEETEKKTVAPAPVLAALEEKKPSMLDRLFHPPIRPRIIKEEWAAPEVKPDRSKGNIVFPKDIAAKIEPAEEKASPIKPVSASSKADLRAETTPREEKIETLDVNLIPDDVLAGLQPKSKLKQLGLTVGIIVVLVGLVYGYMLYRQSQIQGKIAKTITEISGVEQDISKYKDLRDNVSSLKKEIDSINQLLENHVYWSQFLTYLERYTLSNVYYTNMAATINGKLTLSAKAPDLKTLTDQYIIFQNAKDFVENVEISSVASETKEGSAETTVSFQISLSIKPEIFYKNSNSQ